KNTGLEFPTKRITANLAPADFPKQGPSYDLPLAVAILVASDQVKPPPRALFVGELSLDGQVRHVQGILPMVATARAAGVRRAFVPVDDAAEAALLDGVDVIGVANLSDLVAHLGGHVPLESTPHTSAEDEEPCVAEWVDFAE